ncbi:MAG: 30S ribosomal protein S6 [Nitrospinota bacterium]
MILRKYESVLILSYDLDDDKITKFINSFMKIIEPNGGSILLEDRWGKKRLAYPIKKQKSGYYILLKFEAAPADISEIEKFCKYSDLLLKVLIILDNDPKPEELEDKTTEQTANAIPTVVETPPADTVSTKEKDDQSDSVDKDNNDSAIN